MHSRTPGITFHGALSGWFHLGSVDPAGGESQGRAGRTRLTLGITVTIPDARTFMSVREQPGTLDATISFPPLGRELHSKRGAFNLLSPTGAQLCRIATLECAFDARGTSYYLSGRAEVPAKADHDVFRDSTAIPIVLHEGTDERDAVVGAGVLTLTADELAALVSSIRVTDAESMGDTSLTLTSFGHHLLGDLWDAYAHPPGAFARGWRMLTRGARRLIGRR
ncbi:MAG: hypothetical protein O2843_00895 [Chloroflexi bacterium]|nr:hypothetical protein [Chloroflexota bacterium]